MEKLANYLLISGSGKKVGKTSLACDLIEQFRREGVVAIKMSPHFHELPDKMEIVAKDSDFTIVKDTLRNSKDSSRMLQAGAVKSFYVQARDEAVPSAISKLEEEIAGGPVVCESGGLAQFYRPGVHIFVFDYQGGLQELPGSIQPDFLLPSYEGKIKFPFERLGLSKGNWIMK